MSDIVDHLLQLGCAGHPVCEEAAQEIERLRAECAALAAEREAEREACAALCEAIESAADAWWVSRADPHDQGRAHGATECADAIRARAKEQT